MRATCPPERKTTPGTAGGMVRENANTVARATSCDVNKVKARLMIHISSSSYISLEHLCWRSLLRARLAWGDHVWLQQSALGGGGVSWLGSALVEDYNGFWTLPRMANNLSKSHLKVDVVVRESLVDGRQNLLSHLKGRPYISRAGGRAGVRSPTPWNANIWKPRPFLRPVLVGWFDLPSGIAPRSVRRHRAPDMR